MKKKFKSIAKNVIDLEIKGLIKLKKFINNSFNKAIESIATCQSKVIFGGVGKSGLIASKIASTFSSIGTPAFSISAADCSHGDLGSITKRDILILISNSGNSEELKNIIQYANRYGIKLIGIMSKKKLFVVQKLKYQVINSRSKRSRLWNSANFKYNSSISFRRCTCNISDVS